MRFLYLFVMAVVLAACASDPKYHVKRPLLYDISKDGVHKGYLFGTIHLGVDVGDLPKEFWPIFDAADNVAMEIDVEKYKEKVNSDYQRFLRKDDEKPVKAWFTKAQFEKIHKIFVEEYGSKADLILDKLNVYAVSAELSKYYFDRQEVVGAKHGEVSRLNVKFMLDKNLQERAKKNSKIMTYFDADILHLVDACIYGSEAKRVEYILSLLDGKVTAQNAYDEFVTMVTKYREGDDSFTEFVSKRTTQDEELDQCLLDQRNELWMPKLVQTLETYDNTFVAVGFAHLTVGSKALATMLTNAGYKVERVPWVIDGNYPPKQ